MASQQRAIGWWALQFTPRVALLDEAVLLEAAASRRLFGGEDRLWERLQQTALALGCTAVARAPTARAALALARAGRENGFGGPLPALLDPLPLTTVTEAAACEATLARLGCRCLGDVRRLPRGGVGRRLGHALLEGLDQAYGLRPETFEWLTLPERFEARLELPSRVEHAEGLLLGGQRLLEQMAGWLAARQAGVHCFTFIWLHDFHRGRDAPPSAELEIRTAETTRETGHLARLLAEQLAKVELAASVEEIRLRADDVEALAVQSGSLLQDASRRGESVLQLMERVAARLGPERVQRAVLRADHRPECAQTWQPAGEPVPRKAVAMPADLPLPTWLLDPPIRLALRDERPLYQGPLETIAGPSRIEAGWWDPAATGASVVTRDYYVMASQHAGLLWVYRERDLRSDERSPWFLHGIFG
ncbi:DNA polymerase Y family protein [Eleftheria terrae]|uniref:DNA polymerase Y family protein n=1 Tax=Eleftheria terrae TaxID=1597781 RepID=UPI00263AEF14|nr:DNA polymerase Y family protein [Eleftheria terrae]WKB55829.1 DNA polymerase Y family protein [Eleftheria terrae]